MNDPSPSFGLVIHATHEAGVKVGGIGAVLDGLLGSEAYNAGVRETMLVGTMDVNNPEEMERLLSPSNALDVAYSSVHDIVDAAADLIDGLREIEQRHDVTILYGTRAFGNTKHRILLVDGQHANPARVNAFKAQLYERFGIQSDRYESQPEYNLFVNAAEAQYEALRAIVGDREGTIVAHEFMGLPFCYSATIHARDLYRTVFYGHETVAVRPIVESHPGHDTMFYNVLAQASAQGQYLEDVFGDQSAFYKHALVQPVPAHLDNIVAVGDWVVREMRFLGPAWANASIDLVYNGVPSQRTMLDQKQQSRARLQQYCMNLLGYRPDYIFTHVTRFVPSKGLWRDIAVMQHLAPMLAQQGKRAALFVLATVIPVGRPADAVFEMEARYGWPVYHREANIQVGDQNVPDLVSHEIPFYHAADQFNRTQAAGAIVLVNQFGWSRGRCGLRMPENMQFLDIRQGTDLEFGQSVYEPFGIAQVEPLSYGALCVVSRICGCVGFLERVGGLSEPNVLLADYTDVTPRPTTVQAALSIDQARRDQVETHKAAEIARDIMSRLPQNEDQERHLLESGYQVSQRMSWEVVARDYFLPALEHARRG
ncbi:MAG: hypothetical protein ACK2VD_14270 [Anaerolineae bacterium]